MDIDTRIRDPTPATLTWTINAPVIPPLPHPKIIASDGNGIPIANGSSITSSSITFKFADIVNNNSLCTLDGSGRPDLKCTNNSPTTLQNLVQGRHWLIVFNVATGGKGAASTFTWTVVPQG